MIKELNKKEQKAIIEYCNDNEEYCEYLNDIIEQYLNGSLSAESEAKAVEIQNRRIDYGIHER